MTTIAYDPVSQTFAADRQTTLFSVGLRIHQSKIIPVRLGDRRLLVGLAGDPADAIELLGHYLLSTRTLGFLPVRPPKCDDAEGSLLLVEFLPDDNRRVVYMSRLGGETEVTPLPWALGVGSDFAIGAMRAGADAARGVEIATEYNIHTGHGVQVEDLRTWAAAPLDRFMPFVQEASRPKTNELSSSLICGAERMELTHAPPNWVEKENPLFKRGPIVIDASPLSKDEE